jgi:hypothetical protein
MLDIMFCSQAQHRKYTQGHKAVISPYVKANDSLKRFRKKTKNKVVYDDQKEGQVSLQVKCSVRKKAGKSTGKM